MTKLGFLLVLLPTFLSAQSIFSDPTYTKILQDECQGSVFSVAQKPPMLTLSNEAYADKLAAELRSKNFPMTNAKTTCKFLVTSQSKIIDLTVEAGRVSEQKILTEAILHLADVWAPAQQSGHLVCAYVRIKLKFRNDNLSIDILP